MDGPVLASGGTEGDRWAFLAPARASLQDQLHGVKKETKCEASDSSASLLLGPLPIPQQPLMCAQAVHLQVRGPRYH